MVEIKGLNCSYGTNRVLQELTGTFAPGQIHGILGKNGAGKTTLFNSIFGFKKPDSGKITYQGEPVLKNQISFLETTGFFYPMMTGLEYLNMINNQKRAIEQWNRIFELPLSDYAENYSSGMKKKLAFIGVLLQGRPIWILDEPFNGVDIESNEMLKQIIIRAATPQRTIFIASHILSMLTEICNKIHVLENHLFAKTFERDAFDDLESDIHATIRNQLDDLLSL